MALVEGQYLYCTKNYFAVINGCMFEYRQKSENMGYGPFLQIRSHIVMTTLPQLPYTYQHGEWVGGSPLFVLVAYALRCVQLLHVVQVSFL